MEDEEEAQKAISEAEKRQEILNEVPRKVLLCLLPHFGNLTDYWLNQRTF